MQSGALPIVNGVITPISMVITASYSSKRPIFEAYNL